MGDPKMYLFVSLFVSMMFAVHGRLIGDACRRNTLAVYKIRMETHWSEELFPKQYPTHRPRAQFSRLLGMAHNSSYVLWRLGSVASPEVRLVAEIGSGELPEQMKGVRDVFAAPRVVQGVGSTESIIYSDGKHTKLSVISKIVPSPDWFVGLDSFELCLNGYWLNNITIEEGPIDAGTNNGFTFTAPKWPNKPQSPISRLTAQEPSHPANSFYYPNLKILPPLVTFRITKERVYRAKTRLSKRRRKTNRSSPIVVPLSGVSRKDGSPNVLAQAVKGRRGVEWIRKKASRKALDCGMSQWSDWSSCSASCGVGFEHRTRKMLEKARKNDSTCPAEMQQKRLCGQRTNCIEKYFNW